ncbi:MAG TPA: TolC family protein [Bryobacteraceae bacterium]
MYKLAIAFTTLTVIASAEVRPLTLRQTLELAARQNPDVTLARLDEQRAEQGIKVAVDPFRPKIYGGSGLAETYGYPNSIDGSAPSLFQLKTDMAIYDRSKSYRVASAREIARGSQFGAQAKAGEVAYQAADLFLTASRAAHEGQTISGQLPSLQHVVESMSAAVNEGAELPLELSRARVNLAMSQERLSSAKLDQDYYEMMLAVVLGYPASDRVQPIDSDLGQTPAPPSEEEAANQALSNNRELKQMQSSVLAKELDVRSYKAEKLPKVNLVAQYAYFLKYNYQNYFQKFQANNFQIGASITIPILTGSASAGMALQTYTDMQKIRVQMDQVRNRIITDTRRSYEVWQKAENIRNLSRMQLDLAREELTVLLAQNGEGRVLLSKVEQARLEEGDRWMALYDAETQVTRAKLAILRQMGTLLAAIQEGPSSRP